MASADACNPFHIVYMFVHIPLVLPRSTNYPPPAKSFSNTNAVLCVADILSVCWCTSLLTHLTLAVVVLVVLCENAFLNVIETLLTGWLAEWLTRSSLKHLFSLMITYIKFTVCCCVLFILCYPIMKIRKLYFDTLARAHTTYTPIHSHSPAR